MATGWPDSRCGLSWSWRRTAARRAARAGTPGTRPERAGRMGAGDRALAQWAAVGLLPAARAAGREGHPGADRPPVARSAARLSRRGRDGGESPPSPDLRAAPLSLSWRIFWSRNIFPVIAWKIFRGRKIIRHNPGAAMAGPVPVGMKGDSVADVRCSCGFTEADGVDETIGDHLLRVFTPEQGGRRAGSPGGGPEADLPLRVHRQHHR